MAERKTEWVSVLVPDDGDPRHGLNGYSNLDCRCDICRAANVEYHKNLRDARHRRLLKDPSIRPHGVETTYYNYKCRCEECSAEHLRRDRARRQKRKES